MSIRDLPLDVRIRLVEDIWDTIAEEQTSLTLSPGQREELERRLSAYKVDGDRGSPAVEAIERVRSSL